MLKLYHSTQSRSVRPRWMLEEIGAPYEVVRLSIEGGDTKKPAYLAINPNGTVPTLVDGDLVIYESAAICQYLADKFPDKKLAPPVGTPARGLYYQWIHYAMSALEPPAVNIFLHTIRKPEAERIPQLVEEGKQQLKTVLGVIDRALAGREFIVGNQFTAADVLIGSTLGWCAMMGQVGAEYANVGAYLQRLMARPAQQRAMAD
jgi:glutathione S-transferase